MSAETHPTRRDLPRPRKSDKRVKAVRKDASHHVMWLTLVPVARQYKRTVDGYTLFTGWIRANSDEPEMLLVYATGSADLVGALSWDCTVVNRVWDDKLNASGGSPCDDFAAGVAALGFDLDMTGDVV